MNLPRPLPVFRQRPPVDPDALAHNVGVVGGRADAHGPSGPAEHVAQVVRDGLQLGGRVLAILLPEDLVKENRVVGRAGRSWKQTRKLVTSRATKFGTYLP